MVRPFVLGALLCSACGRADTEISSTALEVAREEERVARLELEAAKSKKFYLLVDVGASTLSLRLTGVVLGIYRIESLELGVPVREMKRAGARDDALSELFACRSTVVETPKEIVPGPPPESAAETESEEPRTSRVVLVCEPPLTVHLARSSILGFRERVRLPGDEDVDHRVRAFVPPEEADRLFASLPAEMLLLFSRRPAQDQQEP